MLMYTCGNGFYCQISFEVFLKDYDFKSFICFSLYGFVIYINFFKLHYVSLIRNHRLIEHKSFPVYKASSSLNDVIFK